MPFYNEALLPSTAELPLADVSAQPSESAGSAEHLPSRLRRRAAAMLGGAAFFALGVVSSNIMDQLPQTSIQGTALMETPSDTTGVNVAPAIATESQNLLGNTPVDAHPSMTYHNIDIGMATAPDGK